MYCSWCGNEIHPYDEYLSVGKEVLCRDCVESGMEEYDPEGDYIDMQVNDAVDRRNVIYDIYE